MNYTDILEAKNGLKIPFCNKISFHSKYNPEKEADSFASQFTEEARFFIVLGICGAYHISALKKKFPCAKIIAVEETTEDIDFLGKIPEVQKAREDKNTIFADFSCLQNAILQNYKPQIHGNMIITSLRQWEDTFPALGKRARDIIAGAVKLVSADYSVQSHFGKIWQKNIFTNLKLSSMLAESANEILRSVPTEKTAAIIAAGPTLDETQTFLLEKRADFFIIATDTAYTSLVSRNITPDAVVSVDGQMISHAHFFNDINEGTIFLFDLCANSSAAKRILKSTGKLIFSESNHPLAQYASNYTGTPSFIHIEAGSGTVTIAAASFALHCGFKKLAFFGADFSYSRGKSYTKNTYLDTVYRKIENRTHNSETSFDNLLFRTELIKLSDKHYTTEILQSYSDSLSNFLKTNNAVKIQGEPFKLYEIQKNSRKNQNHLSQFNFRDFSENYSKKLNEIFSEKNVYDTENPILLTLLPLCAWIENHKKSSKFNYTDSSLLIAYQQSLRYTRQI